MKRKKAEEEPVTAERADPNASLKEQIKACLTVMKEKIDPSTGTPYADLFLTLPSRKQYPEYYQVIEQPIALRQMGEKNYTSLEEFKADMALMVENAITFNDEGSSVVSDAKMLYSLFETFFSEIETPAAEDAVNEEVQAELDQLIKQLEKATASDGHPLVEFFTELPSAEEYPDYYRVIASPMSLAEIKAKNKRGEYHTSEGMTKDVQTMVANAKHYNEESSDVWKDADALFKLFAKLAHREDLLSDEDHEAVETVTHQKETFHVGDGVAFQYAEDPNARTNVGIITRLWKSESGAYGFNANLFLRPEQTRHPVTRLFYKQEVLRTSQVVSRSFAASRGKVWILHLSQWLKNKPKAAKREDQVFVCDSKYTPPSQHAKIKPNHWDNVSPTGNWSHVELGPWGKNQPDEEKVKSMVALEYEEQKAKGGTDGKSGRPSLTSPPPSVLPKRGSSARLQSPLQSPPLSAGQEPAAKKIKKMPETQDEAPEKEPTKSSPVQSHPSKSPPFVAARPKVPFAQLSTLPGAAPRAGSKEPADPKSSSEVARPPPQRLQPPRMPGRPGMMPPAGIHLPPDVVRRYQTNHWQTLLWYSAPPVDIVPLPTTVHGLDYLVMKRKEQLAKEEAEEKSPSVTPRPTSRYKQVSKSKAAKAETITEVYSRIAAEKQKEVERHELYDQLSERMKEACSTLNAQLGTDLATLLQAPHH